MKLKKAKKENKLINEQNLIKRQSICLAVYDLPSGVDAFTFCVKNNWKTKKRTYKLFLFKNIT